jgi:hypothetical protein
MDPASSAFLMDMSRSPCSVSPRGKGSDTEDRPEALRKEEGDVRRL